MSIGGSKNIRRRARPAATNREALGRWGFTGKLRSGADAYTAEEYVADVETGVIDVPKRGCPSARPERTCETHPIFGSGDSSQDVIWTRYATIGKWTRAGERPQRRPLFTRLICQDCRAWLYYQERQEVFEVIGFDHGLGYVRPASMLLDQWARQEAEEADACAKVSIRVESIHAADALFDRERAELLALTKDPDFAAAFDRRYEQAVGLSVVRHCLACYTRARMEEPQPIAKIRLMVESLSDA